MKTLISAFFSFWLVFMVHQPSRGHIDRRYKDIFEGVNLTLKILICPFHIKIQYSCWQMIGKGTLRFYLLTIDMKKN